MIEYLIPFWGHCDHDLDILLFRKKMFEVGIPYLMCGYIFGWWSVAYYILVTGTLTSGLSSKKIKKMFCSVLSNNYFTNLALLDPFHYGHLSRDSDKSCLIEVFILIRKRIMLCRFVK